MSRVLSSSKVSKYHHILLSKWAPTLKKTNAVNSELSRHQFQMEPSIRHIRYIQRSSVDFGWSHSTLLTCRSLTSTCVRELSSLLSQRKRHFIHMLYTGLQRYSIPAVTAESCAPNFSNLNSPQQD